MERYSLCYRTSSDSILEHEVETMHYLDENLASESQVIVYFLRPKCDSPLITSSVVP